MKKSKYLLLTIVSMFLIMNVVKAEEKKVTYQVYKKGDVICRSESDLFSQTQLCSAVEHEKKYVVEIENDTKEKDKITLKKVGTEETKEFDKKDIALAKLKKSEKEYISLADEEKNVTEIVYYKDVQEALDAADDYDHVEALVGYAKDVNIRKNITLDVGYGWMFDSVINNGTIVLQDRDIWIQGELSGTGSMVYNETNEEGTASFGFLGNLKSTDLTFKFLGVELEDFVVANIHPLADNVTEEQKNKLVAEVNEKMKKMIEKSIPGYTTKYVMHDNETDTRWAEIVIVKKVEENPKEDIKDEKPSNDVVTTTKKDTTVKNPSTGDDVTFIASLFVIGAIIFSITFKKSFKKN